MPQGVKTRHSVREDMGSDTVSVRIWVRSLALLSGLRSCAAASWGVGHRCGLDLALLWCRLAAAAPIRRAWELPHATCVALKRKKKKRICSLGVPTWESNRGGLCCCRGAGLIPGLVQWAEGSVLAVAMGQAAAVARIQSPARELSYVTDAAIRKKKKKKKLHSI